MPGSMLRIGQNSLACSGRQPFVGDAGEPVGVDVAAERLLVVMVVREHHHAARREHHVVVEFLATASATACARGRRSPPRPPRGSWSARWSCCARCCRRRASPFRARRCWLAAVFLGHVIGGGEAVAAGADDDGVVGRLGLGRAPLLRPSLMAAQRLAGEAGEREFQGATSPGRDRQFVACGALRLVSIGAGGAESARNRSIPARNFVMAARRAGERPPEAPRCAFNLPILPCRAFCPWRRAAPAPIWRRCVRRPFSARRNATRGLPWRTISPMTSAAR